MATLADELRKQKSPAEALTFLASHVEGLESRIQDLERANVSGWDEWSGETPPLVDESEVEWSIDPAEKQAIEDEIADLNQELHGCEDSQESEVLRAKIELAEDKLKPPHEEPDLDQERTTPIVDEKGNVVNEVAVVSPEKEAQRWEFAEKVLKLEEIYGPEKGKEYIDSYSKAGPLLLYYTDRDFVLGLSDEIKRVMISDVLEQSPREAHEMSRDILKDLESNGPDVHVENIIKTMGR